jgi:hypothetical protein
VKSGRATLLARTLSSCVVVDDRSALPVFPALQRWMGQWCAFRSFLSTAKAAHTRTHWEKKGRKERMELFIVQKCWFDGPAQHPAVDYPRLFATAADAERVALTSAHLYAAAGGNNNGSATRKVRTVPLRDGGAYGFSAAGCLFWIRRVRAAVVVGVGGDVDGNAAAAATAGGGTIAAAQQQRRPQASRGHCLTDAHGIVGGTGNPHSRRGTERLDGVVFVGDGAAAAAAAAAATTTTQPSSPLTRVAAWPVGPPPPQRTTDDDGGGGGGGGDPTADWPDRATAWPSPIAAAMPKQETNRRPLPRDAQSSWNDPPSSSWQWMVQEGEEGIDNDERPGKRRCHHDVTMMEED